ncbi:MAG: hypothetical protein M1522_07840 [Actinobacteria bacterium]|nr:hypothetical protein [Actinomycetota bacterium]
MIFYDDLVPDEGRQYGCSAGLPHMLTGFERPHEEVTIEQGGRPVFGGAPDAKRSL